MKRFCFTIDDNIRFLQELTNGNYESMFCNPYLSLLKKLHDTYGIKIQLNLFYQNPTFTLAQMTDKYKSEWEQNSQWLKLSFHSRLENAYPYQDALYEEVHNDCKAVHDEILRFAGEKSLGKTTTVHCCVTTKDGVRAFVDNKVQGLLGLYGTDEEPRSSYACDEVESARARKGEVIFRDGMYFMGINVVLNLYKPQQIVENLQGVKDRKNVSIMIHEQHFYPDFLYYREDYFERIVSAVAFLQEQGFTSCFFEEMI